MKRHAEEYTDTDPHVMEIWHDMQRRMSAGDKLTAVLDASQLVLQAYEMGVRALYPNASDAEVRCRVAARHLPPELVLRVYGWDPSHAAG
jgi:hypothetical protein